MEVLFIVYCHINKINNKKYIGITCQNPVYRWCNGKGYPKKTQPRFAAAIEKYGWENFSHEILFENLSEAEAKLKEIELIAYYHTYVNDPLCWGYNMTRGGQGSLKYITIEEQQAAKAAYKPAYDRGALKYKEKLQNDPILYKKYLDRKAADKRRARQNPRTRKEMNARTQKCHNDVKQLREYVMDLNSRFPNILSEEEKYNLRAANRCRSIKYLTLLKLKFEGK